MPDVTNPLAPRNAKPRAEISEQDDPSGKAASLMVAIEAGGTIRNLVYGIPGPAIWSLTKFRAYCTADPEWADRIKTLSAINGVRNIIAAAEKRGAMRTHCPKGHALTDANVRRVVARSTGWNYRECRICRLEWDRRSWDKRAPLMSVKRGLLKPKAGSFSNLRAPALTGRIAAQPDELFDLINRTVPHMDPQVRRDVINSIYLDIAEGRLDIAGIAGAVRRHKAMQYGRERWHAPLNAPAFADGTTSLIDRISSNEGVWGTELYRPLKKWS
jgi:hypothetical protein